MICSSNVALSTAFDNNSEWIFSSISVNFCSALNYWFNGKDFTSFNSMYLAWSRMPNSALGSCFVNGTGIERISLRFKVTVTRSPRPCGVVFDEFGSVAAGTLIPASWTLFELDYDWDYWVGVNTFISIFPSFMWFKLKTPVSNEVFVFSAVSFRVSFDDIYSEYCLAISPWAWNIPTPPPPRFAVFADLSSEF